MADPKSAPSKPKAADPSVVIRDLAKEREDAVQGMKRWLDNEYDRKIDDIDASQIRKRWRAAGLRTPNMQLREKIAGQPSAGANVEFEQQSSGTAVSRDADMSDERMARVEAYIDDIRRAEDRRDARDENLRKEMSEVVNLVNDVKVTMASIDAYQRAQPSGWTIVGTIAGLGVAVMTLAATAFIGGLGFTQDNQSAGAAPAVAAPTTPSTTPPTIGQNAAPATTPTK